jgi:DNA mismatch repair protein MutS2
MLHARPYGLPSGAPGADAVGSQLAGAKLRAFSSEIDLRGQTVEEAVPQVDKYIDDAVLAGVKRVRLIHGKGTGALRDGLTSYLRGHPNVAALVLAPLNEGGDGVTVVDLK